MQGEDQNGDTDSETGNRWHGAFGSLVAGQKTRTGTPIAKPGIGGTVTLASGFKIKRLARRRRSFVLLVVLVRIFLRVFRDRTQCFAAFNR